MPHTIRKVMNKFLNFILLAVLFACNQQPVTGTFGEKFDKTGAKAFTSALSEFQSGVDTTYVIEGKIDNVCSHSGCWISFKNGESDFYVNTNEKFTMPKESKGKHAIAKGKFVKDDAGEISFEPTGVIIE